MNIFRRLTSTEYMVKEHMRRGEIPSNKEAYSHSLRIAGPAVVEMVSIALMDMIDVIMIGRIGSASMTAVGLSGQPRMLILSIFFALNIALTAIIARKKGAGDMDAAKSAMRHGLLLNVALGLKLTLIAVIFARPLMNLVGAQPDTIDDATTYFRILSFFVIPQVMTMTICAAQRALGNTKITLKVNVAAKIVGLTLNFLLIEGRFGFPRMEVEGVAWARSIAMLVAFVLAMMSVLRKDSPLRISIKDNWSLDIPILRSIGRLTANGMLEQVGLRFGFLVYARVIAELGTYAFASHVIAMQVMMISFTFAEGIGAATTALVGQYLGKGRPDLSSMYGKIGLRMAFVCSVVLATFCIFFRYQFAGLFSIDPNEYHVINVAAGLILILAYALPLQTTQLVMGGSLRGAGDNRYVAITMLITVGVMRPLFGFLLAFPLGMGLRGAWIAIIIDQGARLALLLTRFIKGKWTLAKV